VNSVERASACPLAGHITQCSNFTTPCGNPEDRHFLHHDLVLEICTTSCDSQYRVGPAAVISKTYNKLQPFFPTQTIVRCSSGGPLLLKSGDSGIQAASQSVGF
jgi:hypothetical protein